MEVKITIDEKKLNEMVEEEAKRVLLTKTLAQFDRDYLFKNIAKPVIKQIYDNHKQEIIDKIVAIATKEVVRKAIPQLVERITKEV